jgi:hypothetical protein
MGQGSSLPSSEASKLLAQLLSAILAGDLDTISGLVFAHPELLIASLDLELGHTPTHYAVISKQHGVLSFLLSCATISSQCQGKREAVLKKLAMQVLDGRS